MKPASVVLKEAAELIQELGHWKDTPDSPVGGTCISNAIVKAGGSTLSAAHNYVLTELDLPHDTMEPLFAWNDAPERTPTEVIDTLLHASKRAREDEDAE